MQIGKLNLFDPDIHKIPEYNWQKFQRCLILDSGVGSTVTDVIQRANTIAVMAGQDRKDDLFNELINLKLSLYSAIEGISYGTMAFACLVRDLDGVEHSIITDADINTFSKLIVESGITHGEIADYVDNLKKKLMPN